MANIDGFLQYNPVNGDMTGGTWLAVGGKTLHIYVDNPNILGLHGWDGHYEAFAINSDGSVEPHVGTVDGSSTYIGSHMAPMMSYTFSYQTNQTSQSGLFLWSLWARHRLRRLTIRSTFSLVSVFRPTRRSGE